MVAINEKIMGIIVIKREKERPAMYQMHRNRLYTDDNYGNSKMFYVETVVKTAKDNIKKRECFQRKVGTIACQIKLCYTRRHSLRMS